MKKIISIVLALATVFALFAGTTVLASANEITTENTAIVTVADDELSTELPDGEAEEIPDDETTDTTAPTLPTEEEFSEWISDIISKVLAILAKICEVLFENILW